MVPTQQAADDEPGSEGRDAPDRRRPRAEAGTAPARARHPERSGAQGGFEATVLTNPTHFSVALRYRPGVDAALVVVARGAAMSRCRSANWRGRQCPAARISAADPRDLFTARGTRDSEELFVAVATVLAFVFQLERMVPKVRRPRCRCPAIAPLRPRRSPTGLNTAAAAVNDAKDICHGRSIAASLGFGSGIDEKLVEDLSAASRDPKVARIASLNQQNQARISALAQARSNLDGFADSLSQMVMTVPCAARQRYPTRASWAPPAAPAVRRQLCCDGGGEPACARADQLFGGCGQPYRRDRRGDDDADRERRGDNDNRGCGQQQPDGLANRSMPAAPGLASIIADEGGHRLILKVRPARPTPLRSLLMSAPIRRCCLCHRRRMTQAKRRQRRIHDRRHRVQPRCRTSFDDVVRGTSLTLKGGAGPAGRYASRPLDMIKQTVGDFVAVYNQLKKSVLAASGMAGPTTSPAN